MALNASKENLKKRKYIIAVIVAGLIALLFIAWYLLQFRSSSLDVKKQIAGAAAGNSKSAEEAQNIRSLLVWIGQRANNTKFYDREELPLNSLKRMTEEGEKNAIQKIDKMKSVIELLLKEYGRPNKKSNHKNLQGVIYNVLKDNYMLRCLFLLMDNPMDTIHKIGLLNENNKCTGDCPLKALEWLLLGHDKKTVSLFNKIIKNDINDADLNSKMTRIIELLLRVVITNPPQATRRRELKQQKTLPMILDEIDKDKTRFIEYIDLKNSISSRASLHSNAKKERFAEVQEYRNNDKNHFATEEETTMTSIVSLVAHVQRAAAIDNVEYFNGLIEMGNNSVRHRGFYSMVNNKNENHLIFFIEYIRAYIGSTEKSSSDPKLCIFIQYLDRFLKEVDAYSTVDQIMKSKKVKQIGDLQKISTGHLDKIEEVINFTDRLISLVSLEVDYIFSKKQHRYILYELANCYRSLVETNVSIIPKDLMLTHILMNSNEIKELLSKEKASNKEMYVTPAPNPRMNLLLSSDKKKGSAPINVISRAIEVYAYDLSYAMQIFNDPHRANRKK
ncbi:uncharacterized protein NEPG_00324 [Nematocida parisii ERTm1]|uniref:uncharacterized protein n=1 Tax=Nematocida parisii (strain ERTm1 / ATCC PRA-289) TaxID=881290 RepID=UPI000264BBBD|nr:uncharacterized protein NEPG_00324 [Nematocida parisii ERTm1]EIJ94800.1 hypothetical protein NEPG_00324 [Nematocida parisii ERTm1]|eukprot:XP_013058156.1 hypothetical protein NEPG_00324 [Nematocida parisii ERTm1]